MLVVDIAQSRASYRVSDEAVTQDGFQHNGNSEAPFRRRVAVMVEVLMNLTYLASISADDPEQVRKYMGLADRRLRDFANYLDDPMNTKGQAS